jgi:uncharacterized protein YyaL (SSP411 family)
MICMMECHPDSELTHMALQLSDGILAMQQGPADPIPGAFLSWPGLWHGWGNCQTAALTTIGRLLNEPRLIDAAENEAVSFYTTLINDTLFHAISMQDGKKELFSQIAYDIRPMVTGLMSLYRVTGKQVYAQQAGLAASWFLGRNAARAVMYDAGTGRCYDGIDAPDKINLNSGAESTIEALLTLLEIAADPAACRVMMEYAGSVGNDN